MLGGCWFCPELIRGGREKSNLGVGSAKKRYSLGTGGLGWVVGHVEVDG